MFSSTEAQFLGDFSSTQAGLPYVNCASKIEQDFYAQNLRMLAKSLRSKCDALESSILSK